MIKGHIRQSLSGYYDVITNTGISYRTRARGNFRKKGQIPLVGDWVEIKADNVDEGYILKIFPRKNELIRPPVVNVDFGIVVSACTEPKFSSNLLDRQLLMLELNNIIPILYFSKFDLLNEKEKIEMKDIIFYYSQYYKSFYEKPEFILKGLKNKVSVVMGQTGAGKSTLLNKFDLNLNLETDKISKALSRGKHTTRKVTLLDIRGALIADTPGFSSFDLLKISKEELANLYPDFLDKVSECRYRGCMHINEPDCAVKKAFEDGIILKSRYENYLQLYEFLSNQKPKYKRSYKK